MTRRKRQTHTTRSEHWMRIAANEKSSYLNHRIRTAFAWSVDEFIEWRSPVRSDQYAEYYDNDFLDRLGISNLSVPLDAFWPRGGPRWDGLALTVSGKRILVEAKAYPEEGVDFGSQAGSKSKEMIEAAMAKAKFAFGASDNANWMAPFYQYANRLAHLYFLAGMNELDAYLVFLYFADAPDVPSPCNAEQWVGAKRLIEKCLGIPQRHRFSERITTVIIETKELLSNISMVKTLVRCV